MDGAIGRKDNSRSFHNYNKWGEVLAIDVFPHDMNTREDFRIAVQCAEKAGMTGIGIYPEARPSPMLHLDVGKRGGDGVGYWSAYRHPSPNRTWKYFSIDKAL